MKPLVFIHGWAQSQQIWFQQHELFDQALFLNLPGHGGEPDLPADAWVEHLLAQLPEEPCVVVGWSLGGMLAMQMAMQAPEKIAALALAATTPRFRATDTWPHGSSEALFEGFQQAIDSGSPKALSRFFALMLHGDGLARETYNSLAKQAVDRNNKASSTGLNEGLTLLKQLDLRALTAEVRQPVLMLHGSEDAIVPFAAGRWLSDALSTTQQLWLDDCGHAPFLTRPEAFNSTLQTWWQTQ